MRRSRLLVLVALVVLVWAAPAMGQGINLAWDQCWPEGGTANKRFACDTNAGWHAIVGSFVPVAPHPHFLGIEVILDVNSVASTLPDWWQFFNPGSCRRTALMASADFTSAPQTACVDPWGGSAVGGIAAYQTVTTTPPVPNGLPSSARLLVWFALQVDNPLQELTEYYGFRLRISNAKTVGDSACAGCDVDMCITLKEIKVVDSDGSVERLSSPVQSTTVTWACGAWLWTYPPSCYHRPGCTVAARNTTWGQVKGLYR